MASITEEFEQLIYNRPESTKLYLYDGYPVVQLKNLLTGSSALVQVITYPYISTNHDNLWSMYSQKYMPVTPLITYRGGTYSLIEPDKSFIFLEELQNTRSTQGSVTIEITPCVKSTTNTEYELDTDRITLLHGSYCNNNELMYWNNKIASKFYIECQYIEYRINKSQPVDTIDNEITLEKEQIEENDNLYLLI